MTSILINGQKLNIYDTDTEETIINRIAFNLNTLPQYLWFTSRPKQQLLEGGLFIVKNVIQDMEDNIQDISNLGELKNRYENWNDILITDHQFLLQFFIIKTLDNDEMKNFQIMLLGQDLGSVSQVENIYNKQNAIIQDYKSQITKFKAFVIDEDKRLEDESKIIASLETLNISEFKVSRTNFTFKIIFNVDINLLTLFDNINDENLLLSNINVFYKVNTVLIETIPSIELFEEQNVLTLILYPQFVIKIKLESNNTVIVNYEINISDKIDNIKLQIVEILSKALPQGTTLTIEDEKESKIQGSYTIFNTYLIREIFLDLIMNNALFYSMYVDERLKVQTRKYSLRIVYNSLQTGKVIISINNNINNVIVKINSIDNRDVVPIFIKKFNGLFSLYLKEADKIIKEYEFYGIQFTIPVKSKKGNIKETELRKQVPELFLPLYSRKCPKQPKIVSEDEAKQFTKLGTIPIKFPIKGEGNLKPLLYSCDNHKTHPYPGLRINKLPNKETFPYIPCCYINNQEDRYGSPYRHYYYNEGINKDITDHDIYLTLRILGKHNFGVLPSDIIKLYPEHYRYGTSSIGNPNSVLNCIATCLNITIDPIDLRKNVFPKYIPVCRQETWDIKVNDLKSWIQNPNLYFDPRRFYRILEEYFNISIFMYKYNLPKTILKNDGSLIFIKSSNKDNGKYCLPKRSKIGKYVMPIIKRQAIILFIHMGSEADAAKIPQCELLIKTFGSKKDMEKNMTLIFENGSMEILTCFNIIYKLLIDYTRQPSYLFNIEKQYIDNTGKTRILYCIENNIHFTVLVDPIAPLLVPITTEIICIPISKQISSMLKIKYSLSFNENTLYSEGIKIYIEKCNNLVSDNDFIKYNTLRKLSRLLFEYVLIDYLNSNLTIDSYFDQKTIIDVNKTYKLPIDNTISSSNKIFTVNNYIIFNSETLQERLKYNLIIAINRYSFLMKQKIKSQLTLNSYYDDVSDFKINYPFIIIYGYDNIHDNKFQEGEVLVNTLKLFENYKFFKNDDIDNGRLFLAKCFTNVNDIPRQPYIIDLNGTKIQHGYLYLYDFDKGFTTEILTIPLRLIIFKIQDITIFINLSDVIN
ncbi:hypothetical protein AGMMS49579_01330 [Spirochaetia bacterium]|nr:hypothetical protein AGMMS49579_01330 [Spirochaetia bacterium]